jgi:arylsulfatase A-like enzyme
MIRLLLSLLCFAAIASAADRPNVVMIISDDHAWTDYGFMGHKHLSTPHMDQLAKESLTFTRGYVPSSLCCPSLATIITGLYPHQHKITSNDPPMPAGAKPRGFQTSKTFLEGRQKMVGFMNAVPTLPKLFVNEGYTALQTGKWWLGEFSNGGFTHGMTKGGRHGDEGLDIGRKTMQPIADHIALSKREGKPFLVWYAPMMPHDPHTPPDRLFQKYLPLAGNEHLARYWAMVEWFDETIGELMKQLKDQGVSDNTIVMYVTDNGWIQNLNSTKYAPKSKQSPYDGGLRTPIMLHYPAKVKPAMVDTPVSSIDLFPTLLKLCGIAAPSTPGIDLTDPAAVAARSTIYGECFHHNFQDMDIPSTSLRFRWVLEGGKKLIVPQAKLEPDAKTELYDVLADPTEEKDLSGADAATVGALAAKLDAWWKP